MVEFARLSLPVIRKKSKSACPAESGWVGGRTPDRSGGRRSLERSLEGRRLEQESASGSVSGAETFRKELLGQMQERMGAEHYGGGRRKGINWCKRLDAGVLDASPGMTSVTAVRPEQPRPTSTPSRPGCQLPASSRSIFHKPPWRTVRRMAAPRGAAEEVLRVGTMTPTGGRETTRGGIANPVSDLTASPRGRTGAGGLSPSGP